MSKRIAGERKQRTRRFVIVGTLVAILSILAFVPAAREGALDLVRLSEQLKDAQGGAFATVAVVIFVIFAIVENAEKLHFIWEMGHKLLGYDLESMERHEREFTDLPDDYTRRPKLEKDLVTELAPLDEPKLVVFLGAHDTGKTTTLRCLAGITIRPVAHRRSRRRGSRPHRWPVGHTRRGASVRRDTSRKRLAAHPQPGTIGDRVRT